MLHVDDISCVVEFNCPILGLDFELGRLLACAGDKEGARMHLELVLSGTLSILHIHGFRLEFRMVYYYNFNSSDFHSPPFSAIASPKPVSPKLPLPVLQIPATFLLVPCLFVCQMRIRLLTGSRLASFFVPLFSF